MGGESKSYAFKYKKTSKMICTYKRRPSTIIPPPDVTPVAREFVFKLGGAILESSRSNLNNLSNGPDQVEKVGPD